LEHQQQQGDQDDASQSSHIGTPTLAQWTCAERGQVCWEEFIESGIKSQRDLIRVSTFQFLA
jgi:hypothetical protein